MRMQVQAEALPLASLPEQAEVVLPLARLAEQVDAARLLMLDSLVNRGFPRSDAEDAVKDVIESITFDTEGVVACLAAIDDHGACLARLALDAYLVRLRAERRRRGDDPLCGCVG